MFILIASHDFIPGRGIYYVRHRVRCFTKRRPFISEVKHVSNSLLYFCQLAKIGIYKQIGVRIPMKSSLRNIFRESEVFFY